MKQLICPKCKVPIDASGIDGSAATCQRCHSTFRISTKSAKVPPPTTSGSGVAPAAVPPPPPPPGPAASTQFAPSINVPDAEEETARSTSARNRVMLIVAAAGLMIGCLVMAAVVFGPGGDDPSQPEQSTAAAGAQAAINQDGPRENSPGTDGGLLDLSDLMEFEATAPRETIRESPTDLSQSSQSSDDVFNWPEDVKLISIPSGAVVTVDGVVQTWLLASGFADMSLRMPSPPGTHVISLSSSGPPNVTKSGGFPAYYIQQKNKYSGVEGLDISKLTKAAVAVNGTFRDPILPHLLGNYYWQQRETGAAERFWKLAIGVSPVFAPAHLNLAYAAGERGDLPLARHELMLASSMNIQDAFGISSHAAQLQQSLTAAPVAGLFSAQDYWFADDLPLPRIEVINVLLAMRDLTHSPADKAACLNNIGVYLMHKASAPGPAFGFFQLTQLALADVPPEKASELSKTVLANLVKAAESANFVEVELFRELASRSRGTSR